MKIFVLLILFFSSLTATADQEVFKEELFKTDVHPFLMKNCSSCHSEKAGKHVGPPHSNTDVSSAFEAFNKRLRVGDVERSTMWRVGTNGHFCKEFDTNCDILEEVIEDLKGVLTKYVEDIEKSFPSKKKASNTIISDGENISTEIEIARDIYNRPIFAILNMQRLKTSDYVIVKELRIKAHSGFFLIEGLDIFVNGSLVTKQTGFEDIKRKVFFSPQNSGSETELFSPELKQYEGPGKILAPFQPMIKFADGDRINIKAQSIQQLKNATTRLCSTNTSEATLERLNGLSKSTLFDNVLKFFGISDFEVNGSSPCHILTQLFDFENLNRSPLLLEAEKYFMDPQTLRDGTKAAKERIDNLIELYLSLEKKQQTVPSSDIILAELIGNDIDLAVINNPELKKGLHLYNTAGCVNCHNSNMSGGLKLITPGGNFYTPNISPDPTTGIGNWSLNDFKKALKEGFSPDGTRYFAAFPYTTYRNMKDEDIEAIYDYIMASLPKVKVVEKHKPSILANFPFANRIWRGMNTKPSLIDELLEDPDQNLANGAYNVLAITHCGECHTPRTRTHHLNYKKWMQGGIVFDDNGNPEKAPSLVNMKEKGWTAETYKHFLKTGETHNGGVADGKMSDVITNQTSKLSDEELNDVVKYLMSIK